MRVSLGQANSAWYGRLYAIYSGPSGTEGATLARHFRFREISAILRVFAAVFLFGGLFHKLLTSSNNADCFCTTVDRILGENILIF